jgi:diguanylate cyclase (GGDEF)-like protein
MRILRRGGWSLKRKIAAGLVVLIVPTVVLGALGIWATGSTTAGFEAAATQHADDALVMIELRDQLITAEWWAMEYVNEGKEKAKLKLIQLIPQIDRNLEALASPRSDAQAEMVMLIGQAWDVARPVALDALELPAGASATMDEYPLELFHPAMEDAIGRLVDLNVQSVEDMRGEVAALGQRRTDLAMGLGITVLLSLGAAFVISRRIRRSVNDPLERLEGAARRFGDQDFEYRVEVASRDEFGRVADAFNAMADRVAESRAESQGLEQQLRHQALHDPLTGLANRTLLSDRITHAVDHTERTGKEIAVLFLDVDDFKRVNDGFGHDAGDVLLRSIGERIQRCVRSVDTAARVGGDEFAILLDDLTEPDQAIHVAERILESMSFPFLLGDGQEVAVHPSIGIAVSDEGVAGIELLRRADVAMYAAKIKGKNNYVTYEPSLEEAAAPDRFIDRLAQGIRNGELQALYQPLVDLTTGGVAGVEALVRWKDPTEGLLTPDKFLPAAEKSGLIVEIDLWMLSEACARTAAWQAETGKDITVSVNFSARTLQRDDLVDLVAQALEETGLAPKDLLIEITENVFVHNHAMWRLAELKELGVRLAIDDFGTGYSSLNYLTRFPVDILKIDRSFVDAIGRDAKGAELARAIAMVAEALELGTVAEGIEDEGQVEPLVDFGVGYGQGFLFAKPLAADALRELLGKPESLIRKTLRLDA